MGVASNLPPSSPSLESVLAELRHDRCTTSVEAETDEFHECNSEIANEESLCISHPPFFYQETYKAACAKVALGKSEKEAEIPRASYCAVNNDDVEHAWMQRSRLSKIRKSRNALQLVRPTPVLFDVVPEMLPCDSSGSLSSLSDCSSIRSMSSSNSLNLASMRKSRRVLGPQRNAQWTIIE